jgi:hypothetical protein
VQRVIKDRRVGWWVQNEGFKGCCGITRARVEIAVRRRTAVVKVGRYSIGGGVGRVLGGEKDAHRGKRWRMDRGSVRAGPRGPSEIKCPVTWLDKNKRMDLER